MPDTAAATALAAAWPDDRAQHAIIAGAVIVFIFFGVLGTWAALARLDAAAIAPAVVKVDGNRKSVQHLQGGIIKELRIKEGDLVTAGQALIVLDDVQAQAAVDVLSKQYTAFRAQEARLLAERSRAGAINFPEELKSRSDDPDVAQTMQTQSALFESRRAALTGQIGVLKQRISQTREQVTGMQGQLTAQQRQLESTQNELSGLRDLFKRGYVPRQRMLELERSAAALEGQAAEFSSNMMRARQAMEELNLQIIQLQTDRTNQVEGDLRDVQIRVLETAPKLQAARNTLERTQIRAPYSGYIVGLTAYSIGGVVAPGEKIMDIVPDQNGVMVEATVNVDDIRDVRPGMRAEVRLTAYKQRTTPIIFGQVRNVSADRMTDTRTGAGYYVVQIKLDEQDLKRYGDIKLVPGMAAEVSIPTRARTALDYLVRPLTDSLNRSFRQR